MASARRLGLTKPTTSWHVARLGGAGLVGTHPDPRDVRALVVGLTPAGEAMVARLRAARHAWLAAVLDRWSDGDRDTLGALLARLNVDLDAHRAGRPTMAAGYANVADLRETTDAGHRL